MPSARIPFRRFVLGGGGGGGDNNCTANVVGKHKAQGGIKIMTE